MKSGIEISRLPLAFRECFKITKHLGLRFTWIDALCIVQDSAEDWEKESTRMSDIYENAFLTIAAASSSSAGETFLGSCKQGKLFSLACVTDDGNPTMVMARAQPQSGFHPGSMGTGPPDPWDRRAWTLQERVASSRLISFSSSEAQWTCRTRMACECREAELHSHKVEHASVSSIAYPPEAFKFWQSIVSNYSMRSLSDNLDKLPAISGIANTIQRRTKSQYIAGIWMDNAISDLCWCRATVAMEGIPPHTAPSTYRAPSFSWASIDGYVYFIHNNSSASFSPKTIVLNATVNVIGHNPYGRVRSGSIKLHGPLFPGQLNKAHPSHRNNRRFYEAGFLGIKCSLIADLELFQTSFQSPGGWEQSACRPRFDKSSMLRRQTFQNHLETPSSRSITDPQIASSGENTFLEPLASDIPCWFLYLGVQNWESGRARHIFLALGKTFRSPQEYERIGLVMEICEKESDWPLVGDENIVTVTVV